MGRVDAAGRWVRRMMCLWMRKTLGFWGLRRFEDEVLRGFRWILWAVAVMAFELWIVSWNRWVCDNTFVGVVDSYGMTMTLFYGVL